MRAPLVVKNNMYSHETLIVWKAIWLKVCKMAYESDDPISEIITAPEYAIIDGNEIHMSEQKHSIFYEKQSPRNSNEITLDNMWEYYSKKHGTTMPKVVPQFKRLHVPKALFKSLGVGPWFLYSFPNCKITFWEE